MIGVVAALHARSRPKHRITPILRATTLSFSLSVKIMWLTSLLGLLHAPTRSCLPATRIRRASTPRIARGPSKAPLRLYEAHPDAHTPTHMRAHRRTTSIHARLHTHKR